MGPSIFKVIWGYDGKSPVGRESDITAPSDGTIVGPGPAPHPAVPTSCMHSGHPITQLEGKQLSLETTAHSSLPQAHSRAPSLSPVHLSFLSVSCARHQAKHAAKTSAEATVVSPPPRRTQRDTEGNRLPGTTREKPAPGIPPRRSSPSQSSELPAQPPAHTGGTPKLTQVKNKRLSMLLGPSWTDLPGPLPPGTVF